MLTPTLFQCYARFVRSLAMLLFTSLSLLLQLSIVLAIRYYCSPYFRDFILHSCVFELSLINQARYLAFNLILKLKPFVSICTQTFLQITFDELFTHYFLNCFVWLWIVFCFVAYRQYNVFYIDFSFTIGQTIYAHLKFTRPLTPNFWLPLPIILIQVYIQTLGFDVIQHIPCQLPFASLPKILSELWQISHFLMQF